MQSSFTLTEGQDVTFVLRAPPDEMQVVMLAQDDKSKGNFQERKSSQRPSQTQSRCSDGLIPESYINLILTHLNSPLQESDWFLTLET